MDYFKTVSLKSIFLVIMASLSATSQDKLEVTGGNAKITNTNHTKLEILSTAANKNVGIFFGDAGTPKSLIGYHGNDNVLKFNGNSLFSDNHLTLASTGNIGINSLPTDSRVFINHNSTSAYGGAAHLHLEEIGSTDFSRIKFTNNGSVGLWTLAAKATDGNAVFNIFHNDGVNFGNIMSLDGENFRVGINETSPEAYLHIKQLAENVDALVLENDDQTGSENWSFRVDDDDLLFIFEGQTRAIISAVDGSYTAVPPVSSNNARMASLNSQPNVLKGLAKLKSIDLDDLKEIKTVFPNLLNTNDSKNGEVLDFNQLSLLTIKGLQEQQETINKQAVFLKQLDALELELRQRVETIETELMTLNKK